MPGVQPSSRSALPMSASSRRVSAGGGAAAPDARLLAGEARQERQQGIEGGRLARADIDDLAGRDRVQAGRDGGAGVEDMDVIALVRAVADQGQGVAAQQRMP